MQASRIGETMMASESWCSSAQVPKVLLSLPNNETESERRFSMRKWVMGNCSGKSENDPKQLEGEFKKHDTLPNVKKK
jgi:hypothetical protein